MALGQQREPDRLIRYAAHASALTAIALGACALQWITIESLGEARWYDEDGTAAAWWEHANQSAESCPGVRGQRQACTTCKGSWWSCKVWLPFAGWNENRPQRRGQNEASIHAYPLTSQFKSGPQFLPPTLITPALEDPDRYHPGETTPAHLPVVERAAARVASVGGTLTEAEVRAVLVAAGAPAEWHDALVAIAFCESRFSPYAVGDGGNSIGMFQLWQGWARPLGYTVEDLYDPVKAAKVAVYVRSVRGRFGGPGGWSCWSGPG